MPRNEEGEYELLLGNRQLLSIFVIIAVLLGIFFAMGYITGKNSVGGAVAAAKSTAASEEKPAAPDQTAKTPAATGPVAAAAPSNPAPPPPSAAETSATPLPAAANPVASASSTSDVTEPEPGQTFLQVTAVIRHDAEILTDTLNKRGFHARIAPSHSGLFRVLVGPTRDAADLARLRSSLEDAGFRNTIVRKY